MRPRLRHLVVVPPGIGGSVLRTPGGRARWAQHRRNLAATAVDPGRLSLDENPTLTLVGLLPGIRLVGPFVLPGYDRLVHRIERAFHDVRGRHGRARTTAGPSRGSVALPLQLPVGKSRK